MAIILGQRYYLKYPLRYSYRRLGDGARLGSFTDCKQRIVDGTSCASLRWYFNITRRRVGELRLIHVLNRGINPNSFAEVRAVATNVQNGYLRPVGVSVHIKIIESWNSVAIHDGHILSADGDEVLDTRVGIVGVKEYKHFLACLQVDTALQIRSELRIKARACNEYVFRLCHYNRLRLITSAKVIISGTRVIGVTGKAANDSRKRRRWRWCWLEVGRLGL